MSEGAVLTVVPGMILIYDLDTAPVGDVIVDTTPNAVKHDGVAWFVDGLPDGTRANSQSWYWVPDQIIEIGKSHDGYWSGFAGALDEFRIYNRVLSAAEIAQLAGRAILPSLNISVLGNTVTLSWSDPSFILQSNGDLCNTPGWANVPNGATSPVTVAVSPTGNKFYRLKKL